MKRLQALLIMALWSTELSMGVHQPVRHEQDMIMRYGEALSNAGCVGLLAMAIAGDAAAENLAFDRLRRRMLPVARQALRTTDVEDLVQDVLVVVHRKYPDLVAHAKLQDDAGFERWWRRILYHRIGNDIRRRRFECGRCVPAEDLSSVAGPDASDRQCEVSELRRIIIRALKHLSASQRSCLGTGAADARRPEEAVSHRSARYARVYRARKALRQAMRNAGFLVGAAAGVACL